MGRCKTRLAEVLDEMKEEGAGEEGEEACGYVVKHDAGAVGKGFETADGPGFPDVEYAEEEEGEGGVLPVRRHEDEGEELAGDFVDDDEAGVLGFWKLKAAGLAGGDGGGRDADGGDEDCGECGCDREGCGAGREGVCCSVPEQDGGDGAVGAGAGLEVAGAEEGGESPGPAGFGDFSHFGDFTGCGSAG
jgi:hypothetical protein